MRSYFKNWLLCVSFFRFPQISLAFVGQGQPECSVILPCGGSPPYGHIICTNCNVPFLWNNIKRLQGSFSDILSHGSLNTIDVCVCQHSFTDSEFTCAHIFMCNETTNPKQSIDSLTSWDSFTIWLEKLNMDMEPSCQNLILVYDRKWKVGSVVLLPFSTRVLLQFVERNEVKTQSRTLKEDGGWKRGWKRLKLYSKNKTDRTVKPEYR